MVTGVGTIPWYHPPSTFRAGSWRNFDWIEFQFGLHSISDINFFTLILSTFLSFFYFSCLCPVSIYAMLDGKSIGVTYVTMLLEVKTFCGSICWLLSLMRMEV